jgi:cell division protein FtsI/penicillin-binding protein 2
VRKWLIVLLSVIVLAGGTTAYAFQRKAARERRDREASVTVARAFLEAWSRRDFDRMGQLSDAADAGLSFQRMEERLQISKVVAVLGAASTDEPTLPFTVTVTMTGLGEMSWATVIETVKRPVGMRVAFRSKTVHPALENGLVLTRSAPLPARGELTDRHGTPIRPVSADLAANVLGNPGTNKTGLERLFDMELTGSSGGEIRVAERDSGRVISVLQRFAPKPATNVRTTLDLKVQRAAEAVLVTVRGQAALVAIDVKTGQVRAIANRPVAGLPAALRDEAPGSVFKIVVAAAALRRGITPSTTVSCPEQVVFGGKAFRNDEPMPPTMTLTQAFARSCNTAFLTLADGFPKGTIGQTASIFGFGRDQDLLPIGAQGGRVPPPATTSEAYADVIGQGRVEASPLLMASMAAAVANGRWNQPTLRGPSPAGNPIPHAAQLRELMRAVVTTGTAARAGLPAGTAGKTGTAQYGTATPLATHAWFTGYRADLAFCIYVKDGASGGSVAAPLAARFLKALS